MVQIQEQRNERLELVKITSVQTQVVAGMNYKFVLDTATQAQEVYTFEATVYGKDLRFQACFSA